MFFYLIYISIAEKPMDDNDLAMILDWSRKWNADNAVTGMLLYIEGDFMRNYKGGRFIQVLEGEETVVRELFESIKKDKRHFNIVGINESTTEKRNFKDWTMGFKYLDHQEYKKLEGSFDLEDIFLTPKKTTALNVPIGFMKSFYQMNTGGRII